MRAAAMTAILAIAAGAQAQFAYTPPGTLEAPGGGTYREGAGRVDGNVYAPGILFPVEEVPAYANSQIYGFGGYMGGGGGQCDSRNYAYPWHDNYCEERSWDMPMCPSGIGHQGQDIRPSTCADQAHWAVAAANGRITSIGSYSVYLTADDGRRYDYLHMRGVVVSVGQTVTRGQRLGLISDNMGATATSIHLHFNIRMYVDGYGSVYAPTYLSLIRSYEERVGPALPCGTIPAEGGIVDDSGPCFAAYGPAAYWRSEATGNDGGLHWTNAFEASAPSNWARWLLNFDQPGRYRVEAIIDPTWGVYPATRYAIAHAAGETTVIVDQGAADGWVELCVHDFAAQGSVMVYDDYVGAIPADQHIVADAIRLTPVIDVPVVPDGGGSTADAGARGDAGGEIVLASDCGCRAAGAKSSGAPFVALVMLAGLVVRRRPSRRPSRSALRAPQDERERASSGMG